MLKNNNLLSREDFSPRFAFRLIISLLAFLHFFLVFIYLFYCCYYYYYHYFILFFCSYRCECDAGYTAVNNQTRCADVDECSDNNGNCSQICINIEGDRLCECRVGYEPTDPE